MYIYNLTTDDRYSGPAITTHPAKPVIYVLVKENYGSIDEFIEKVLPRYSGIPILVDFLTAKQMYESGIAMPDDNCWVITSVGHGPVVVEYDFQKTLPNKSELGFNLIASPMVARDRLLREFVDTYVAYISADELNRCKIHLHANLTAGKLAELVLSVKTKVKYFNEVLVACKVNI